MNTTFAKIHLFLAGRHNRKVATATTACSTGKSAFVIYHSTNVIQSNGETITLRNGGWMTATTKKRINQFLPDGWHLYQQKHAWFLSSPSGEVLNFEDGMQIAEAR